MKTMIEYKQHQEIPPTPLFQRGDIKKKILLPPLKKGGLGGDFDGIDFKLMS
jgi:hypothetical protein